MRVAERDVGVAEPGTDGQTQLSAVGWSVPVNQHLAALTAFVSVTVMLATSGYALVTTALSSRVYLLCAPAVAFVALAALIRRSAFPVSRYRTAIVGLGVSVCVALPSSILFPSAVNLQALGKFVLVEVFACIVFVSFPFAEIARRFSDAIVALSVISIGGYAAVVFGILPFELPAIENVNGMVYRSALLFFTFDGFLQYRNVGIFWEPGIFATMLFASMLVDLLVTESVRLWRLSVQLIALATTFSGAALVLLAIYACAAMTVNGVPRLSVRTVLRGALVVVIALLVVVNIPVLEDGNAWAAVRVFDKLSDVQGMQSTRLLSPIVSLETFLEKPVWGWGLGEGLLRYVALFPGNALTSTSGFFLAAFGVAGLFYSVSPLVGILVFPRLALATRVVLAAGYFFVVNKEPHTFFTITHIVNLYLLWVAMEWAVRAGHSAPAVTVTRC